MGVINIISLISALGIAIGCAALVIILSVYNGFDSIVVQLDKSHTADIRITPVSGKSFSLSSEGFDELRKESAVRAFCGVVQENVFLQYDRNHGFCQIIQKAALTTFHCERWTAPSFWISIRISGHRLFTPTP